MREESPVHSTHRARVLYIVSFLVLLSGFVSNNGSLVMVALVVLAFLFGLRAYVTYVAAGLRDLKVEFDHDTPIDNGEFEVRVVIKNPGIAPLAFVEYNVRHSPFLKFVKGATRGFIAVPAKSEVVIRMVCHGRVGRHRIGPLELQARDVFGLFKTRPYNTGAYTYIRIPPSYQVAVLRRLAAYARSVGLSRSRIAGAGVEFHSLRDYKPGDELKRIEWRKSVKLNRLVVRQTEREAQQNVYILLDSSHVMLVGPYARTVFEHMSRAMSAIVAYLAQRGDNFQVIVFGARRLVAMPTLMRSNAGLRVALEAMSSVDFEEVVKEERARSLLEAYNLLLMSLKRERNIIIIATVVDSQEYYETLVKVVKELAGLKNIVYVVNPVITSYDMIGIPMWARGLYSLKTHELLTKQLNYSKLLRKSGVNTVVVTSLDAPMKIATLIEQYRSR
ncbi:hypothetical protein TCELL_0680 [Thermogladius calderae 1633]|uniref:DUF58 domain-containing protein n=1 Tax=Thermogladius calderae (strain DSM 22663 / VKM B-2946 / 1633) TaxID=1184251 RepID=I3TEB6_THEC1|nr:DUF58 domain-containing protein [Thermogladius calderae]AFK51104.1 hypothetical protein TCELL_0680 [Thermogladius calderae 1633]